MELVHIGLTLLSIIFCIICAIKHSSQFELKAFQSNYLYITLFCAFLRESLLFINAMKGGQFIMSPNFRIAIMFLMMSSMNYVCSYFTKLKFNKAVTIYDKTIMAISQLGLFIIPFIVLYCFALSPNTDATTIIYANKIIAAYQFPENLALSIFIKMLMPIYLLFCGLSLPCILKGKLLLPKISYGLYFVEVLARYPNCFLSFNSFVAAFPIYYVFSTLALCGFFVTLGLSILKGMMDVTVTKYD